MIFLKNFLISIDNRVIALYNHNTLLKGDLP